MVDTQWPRFQVFLQEREGSPHQDAGSVHAPDGEMALLNARDVFVRRPECVSLWVVPTEAIYSQTAEELSAGERLPSQGGRVPVQTTGAGGEEENLSPKAEPVTYYVFSKAKPAGTQTLVGQVQASTPAQAMRAAVDRFSGQRPSFAWWVVPASKVLKSKAEDVESMFAPAKEKPFRLSTDFHTLTAMREIQAVGGQISGKASDG